MFNKKINFNKSETESTMENLLHSFWETFLVLQLIQESQFKSKTVINWSSWKKKDGIFCMNPLFCLLFIVYYVLSQCIVYWIQFQNIYTFLYQETLHNSYTFLIVLKIVGSQQCILKGCVRYNFTSLFCMSKREDLWKKENVFYFTSKALFVLEIITF